MEFSKWSLITCIIHAFIMCATPISTEALKLETTKETPLSETAKGKAGQRSTNSTSRTYTTMNNTKSEDEVKFYIFTTSSLQMERIKMENPTYSLGHHKNLVIGKPLVLMIHGFLGHCAGVNFPGLLVQAYFEKEQTENIVCVDWAGLAFHGMSLNTPKSLSAYQTAITNGVKVGKKLAEFIKYLIKAEAINGLREIHIIGYSMGAHIAGAAAAVLHKESPDKIGRITGLDPAGPIYSFLPLEQQLDPTDAALVDIYHTSSGKLGIRSRIGHLDFYINGGTSQPECKNTGVPEIDKMEPLMGICSHQMVPQYFADSILDKSLVRACNASLWKSNKEKSHCTEMVPFGEQISRGSSGEFYVFIGAKMSGQIWLPDLSFK